MSELKDKIRQAIKKLNPPSMAVSSMTCNNIQQLANNEKNKINTDEYNKLVRRKSIPQEKQRRPVIDMRQEKFLSVKNWMNNYDSVYLGAGGLGDALLTIAYCYQDREAHVIYGSNSGIEGVLKKLFDLFDIPMLSVNNFNSSMEGLAIFNYITGHRNFRGMAHLPDKLNYGDWKYNTRKYISKVVNKMPLVELFGKLDNPRNTKGIVGIAPSGSDKLTTWKQRWLTSLEYSQIVKRLLNEGYTVFSFGSEQDIDHYKPYENNNSIWFSSDIAVSYPTPRFPINLRHFFRALNACEYVISVDSWVKTYSGLAGIPTKLVKSRYLGRSVDGLQDPSDYIFINSEIWDFQSVEVSELV